MFNYIFYIIIIFEKKNNCRSGGAQSSQSSIKKNVGKPIDPNELRYCICNQVAFGPMVACDYKEVIVKQK